MNIQKAHFFLGDTVGAEVFVSRYMSEIERLMFNLACAAKVLRLEPENVSNYLSELMKDNLKNFEAVERLPRLFD